MALDHLADRGLVKVTGEDAESFLQNLLTQDVADLPAGKLVYGCLLTAPGRFLHDLFIFRDGADFLLECDAARKDDLVRRLKIFKLRAKVIIDETVALSVYAGDRQEGCSFPDPRLTALGFRSYRAGGGNASSETYRDRRIHLGVPEGSTDIKPEVDTITDANLDHLNAVSWTKGCFVGQEVTARMHNRGLAKKRMMIVAGEGLTAGSPLTQGGHAVGEIRSLNRAGTEGLAVLKLSVLAEKTPLLQATGAAVAARVPEWLNLENT